MSNFITRTVILRPFTKGFAADGGDVSGIVKIENAKGKTELSVTAINFAPLSDGNYFIVIADKNRQMEVLKLLNPPCKDKFSIDYQINFDDGFASLILYSFKNTITPVAFGSSLENIIKISEFTKFYAEKYKKNDGEKSHGTNVLYEKKAEKSTNDKQNKPDCREKSDGKTNQSGGTKGGTLNFDTSVNKDEEFFENYNDEAVATENYYEIKTDFSSDNEKTFQNEVKEKEENHEPLYCENADCKTQHNVNSEKEEMSTESQHNEEPDGTFYGKENNFYKTVEEKLDHIFSTYPADDEMAKVIPDSLWAKIPFSKNSFYVVGKIWECNKISYIVYGVPGERNEVPRGFEKYSVFLPHSIFENDDKGYWCMFQSAEDGSLKN